MDNDMGISEKLDKVLEKMNEEQPRKGFRLPWKARTGTKAKLKKSYCLVEMIKPNGSVDFKWALIEDNTIKFGDNYYAASADYIMRYGKYPLIVIPEWGIEPLRAFNPKGSFEDASEKGNLTAAWKLVYNKMKMDLVKPKHNINIGLVLLILGGIVGLVFLLNKMGVIK